MVKSCCPTRAPAIAQWYAHLRDDTLRKDSKMAGKLIADAMNEALENQKKRAIISANSNRPEV
jgi:hypothetical protein